MMNKSARQTHLILGLGTGATQLIQGSADSFVHFAHHDVRTTTLDTYTTGLDGWDFDREVLQTLLDSAKTVLLVVCSGGKAGSAMALFSAEYATCKKMQVDVLMSTPFSWEGRRRTTAASALAECLRAVGAKVTVMNADQLQTTEFDSASEAFAALDAAMAQELNCWIETAK